MAIKIIKFDFPINGTKVTTLEALRDNLTDEIVPLARSGQLERWFKSRQMQEQAQAVAAAVSQHAKDKALFVALCTVLEVEVHPDDVNAIFDAPPQAGQHIKGKNSISSRIDVEPDDTNPIFNIPPESEEIENISSDMKSVSFNRVPTVMGMCVSNTATLAHDTAAPLQWITHRARAYLPLLGLLENFIEDENELAEPADLNICLNLTGKSVIALNPLPRFFSPLRLEPLTEHQGNFLLLSLRTIKSPESAHQIHQVYGLINQVRKLSDSFLGKYDLDSMESKRIYEYVLNCHAAKKFEPTLDANETYKVATLISIDLNTIIRRLGNSQGSVHILNKDLELSFEFPGLGSIPT